jgi:hypothetical protein
MIQPFEFAQYVDITEFAKQHNPHQYNDFVKIFICVDVWDYWIARIVKDMRDDDLNGYEDCPGWFLVERNKIPMENKGDNIRSVNKLKRILDEDDLSNWDCINAESMEEAIEMLDQGFGIGECPFKPQTA